MIRYRFQCLLYFSLV